MTWMIGGLGIMMILFAVIPGLYFWWPSRDDPVCRSDLGVALMTGAMIGLAVLVIQVLVDIRLRDAESDREAREKQAARGLQLNQERQALKLQLALQDDLSGIPLAGKILPGVYLYDKKLTSANFRRADLTRAVLTGSDLTRAKLQDATLFRADLNGATLVDAQLHRANLRIAILTDAVMEGAKLPSAKLQDSDLSKAMLRYADFTGAKLQRASLSGADLRGAIFSGATFDGETELANALYDRYTVWPSGYEQPSCKRAVCEVS